MSARFELDYSEVQKLQEKFKKIPSEVEKTINEFLHGTGVEIATNHILSRMSVSNRNKKHAKDSNPLKNIKFNLGFELKPKPKFRYLAFPDRALGTSVNNSPDEFMKKGLNDSTEKIINGMNEKIDKKIREAFE
jgi:hypothetical protein